MHNIFNWLTYICAGITVSYCPYPMNKNTAFSISSLLLLGGVSYLAAKLAGLDLTFDFNGDNDQHHYC